MFFDLVRKNGRRTRKENGIFFVSLIISVAAFYIFLSLENQDVIIFLKTMESDAVQKLLMLLPAFYMVSLFLLFFLVWFSGVYQLERRKYELGVYLMLGMKRSRLFLLLLAEDLWNSLTALAVGIPVAVFLSEMISLITSKIVGLGIIGHHFSFSLQAVVLTAIGFAGMKLCAFGILSGRMARREILYYFQDSEEVEEKRRSTVFAIIRILAGVLLLGAAYALAISGRAWAGLGMMSRTVILGIAGVFLIFSAIDTALGGIWRRNRGRLGIFTFRQLTEQVSRQWKSLAVTSLLFLAAFCCLAYGISAAHSLGGSGTAHSADFTFREGEDSPEGELEQTLTKTGAGENPQEPYEVRMGLLYTQSIPTDDPDTVREFYYDQLTEAAESLEDETERTGLTQALRYYDDPYLINLSGYNGIRKAMGEEPVELASDMVMIYRGPQTVYEGEISAWEKILARDLSVEIDGKNYRVGSQVCNDPLVADRLITISEGLIVPDEVFDSLVGDHATSYWNVMLNKDLVEKDGMMQAVYQTNRLLQDSGLHYESYLQSMGRQLFYIVAASYLTIYIAVILLVIANTVISVQFLMHQRKTSGRCRILALLGAGYDALCESARSQVRWYFLVPLAAAVVNSIFGLPSLLTGLWSGAAEDRTALFLTGMVVIAVLFVIEYVYMKAVVRLNNTHLLHTVRQMEEAQERL